MQFRGREIAHADLGRKLLSRFAEDLTTYGTAEGSPRMEGRNAHILISPVKTAKEKEKEKEKEREKAAAPKAPAAGQGGAPVPRP